MNAPICEFVKNYSQSGITRFHMPGHKGCNLLGFEEFDITEIKGADSLFDADGIIAQSEKNAGMLFESKRTLYSTGGSTLCIQAMLYLALTYKRVKNPVIIAPRNVHKAFINACGLLDIDVEWVFPIKSNSICECRVSVSDIDDAISSCDDNLIGVYITSPDYLGNIADIKSISALCRKKHIPLIVDNAHGSYLKFLKTSMHPIDSGADICCDSAHKTLPALTGTAYLHIAKNTGFSDFFAENAKAALALFGSTSPSYLALCSLDYCNVLLNEEFRQKLEAILDEVSQAKKAIINMGYDVISDEPLKLTIMPNKCGRTGTELAEYFRENGFECEYADYSCVVLMISPYNKIGKITQLAFFLSKLPMPKVYLKPVEICFDELKIKKAMSIREAVMSKSVFIDVNQSVGRICAKPVIACPPGVPIAISGEVITEDVIRLMNTYNIEKIEVVET